MKKCDICKKEKMNTVTECPDCYLKGCGVELEKQKKEFKELIDKLYRKEKSIWISGLVATSFLPEELKKELGK